eukprot:gb/GEZN01012901.1/.p1 GENE.gb/GEZN01012901.1/~~gb/GEZN01012901.1/.p1  ORF type:complete len:145 (-),score=18.88 gb/GEZN01012901.1/:36-470(-)
MKARAQLKAEADAVYVSVKRLDEPSRRLNLIYVVTPDVYKAASEEAMIDTISAAYANICKAAIELQNITGCTLNVPALPTQSFQYPQGFSMPKVTFSAWQQACDNLSDEARRKLDALARINICVSTQLPTYEEYLNEHCFPNKK